MEEAELKEVEALAQQLAGAPEPVDPNDWPEKLPRQSELLYQKRNYRLWSAACLMAHSMTKSPFLRVLLRIEAVDGMRRIAGLWPLDEAVELLKLSGADLQELSESPLRNRLLQLHCYNAAMVFHEAGHFAKAAEAHAEAAVFCEDEDKKLIELFMGTMAELEDMLVSVSPGSGQMILADCLEDLQQLGARLLELLGDSVDDMRWKANIKTTLALSGWLVQKIPPDAATVLYLMGMSPELRKLTKPRVAVLTAMRLLQDGKLKEASNHLEEVTDQDNITWYCAAMMVKAEIYHRLAKELDYRATLKKLVNLPKVRHGGVLFVILARRKLDEMNTK